MAGQKAKYEEIVDWITEKIESGELSEGDRIYSEQKLVSVFRVSRQTVRHAISVLGDRGLVVSVQGSGTYVKDSRCGVGRKQKTMRIAIMVTYVDEYIFTGIINEIENILSRAEYTLEIAFTHNMVERERRILQKFLREDVIDGVIAETTKSGLPNPNLDFYRELKRKGIPVVFINSSYPELSAIHVSMDDFWAGKTATEHLLECGHQKIGGIFKLDDGQGHKRYAGYMSALMEHDIRVKDEHISWIDTIDLYRMEQEGESFLERLKDCTACVCYNDEVAVKLINLCRMNRIAVPGKLSVVGIDNSNLAVYCDVPLTSVDNPIIGLARNAAGIMLSLLNSEKVTESVELTSELVIRNSTRIIDNEGMHRGGQMLP